MRRLRLFVLVPLVAAVSTVASIAAPESTTSSPELAAAHGLYTARRDGEAKTAFEAILAADPANAQAEYYLGRLAKRTGDWETVAAHYRRCTELAPTTPLYWADLGEAYGKLAGKASVFRQLGLARKCRTALEKAVELAPNDLEFRRGLAEYYEKAPRIAGGGHAKALEQTAEIAKRDAFAGAMASGGIQVHAKNWAEAEAAFLEAARLRPAAAEPQLALGDLFARIGKKNSARAAYMQALRLVPDHPRAIQGLARLGSD